MAFDQKIVQGCIAGKRFAQSKLYKHFAPLMLGLCLRYSKNRQEAEDILQEGFIKVFKNIRHLRRPEAIESWIRSIMVNTAITHLKKLKFYYDEIPDDQLAETDEEENRYSYSPADPQELLQIITELPEGYRMVLNLYVFEGYMHKEIAEILGISENTSKSQLSKARKYIRNKLEDKNLAGIKQVDHEKRI